MKTIKFRGVTKSGDTIIGDLTHSAITGLPKIWVNGSAVNVDPDSVQMFLGFDKHGNEIFDGDILSDSDGNSVIAHLSPYLLPDSFNPNSIKHIGDSFNAFSLEV